MLDGEAVWLRDTDCVAVDDCVEVAEAVRDCESVAVSEPERD